MIHPRVFVAVSAITIGSSGPVLAQTCAIDKLATPDFQAVFQARHDDLIVLLDVDKEYERLLRETSVADTRSDVERQQYLHELARNLTVAKEQRFAGSKFRIYFNIEFGREVVIRAEAWADVCELASNPHVVKIWLNLPTHRT